MLECLRTSKCSP